MVFIFPFFKNKEKSEVNWVEANEFSNIGFGCILQAASSHIQDITHLSRKVSPDKVVASRDGSIYGGMRLTLSLLNIWKVREILHIWKEKEQANGKVSSRKKKIT